MPHQKQIVGYFQLLRFKLESAILRVTGCQSTQTNSHVEWDHKTFTGDVVGEQVTFC